MVLPAEEHERLLALYRQRIEAVAGVDASYGLRWRTWCRSLLVHGGSLVVPPAVPEHDLEALLADASRFGPVVRLIPRGDGACHENVASMWIDGEFPSIGTGYALTNELWRQHSWGVDADGMVVETTSAEREIYVGIVLPPRAASMQFAGSNAQTHLKAVLQAKGPRAPELIAMIRELAGLAKRG